MRGTRRDNKQITMIDPRTNLPENAHAQVVVQCTMDDLRDLLNEAVLSQVREQVNNLKCEIRYSIVVSEDNEQLFYEIADNLQTIAGRIDNILLAVPTVDCKKALKEVGELLLNMQTLAEHNEEKCNDVCDCMDMQDIVKRISEILFFYISRYESMKMYLTIEKMAGKICR